MIYGVLLHIAYVAIFYFILINIREEQREEITYFVYVYRFNHLDNL